MDKQLMVLSDGTFSFSESDVENQFYFYRNDKGVLGDVGRIPMDFYQEYICHKMFSGEIKGAFASNVKMEISDDNKCIRITELSASELSDTSLDSESTADSDSKPEPVLSQSTTATTQQPNFFKRLFKKLFG